MEENKDKQAEGSSIFDDMKEQVKDFFGKGEEESKVIDKEDDSTIDAGKLQEENGRLAQQVAELKDKYLRLYADFDNAKKRHAREQLDMIQTASKNVIKDILPVIDDFERGLKTIETATEIEPVKEGVLLIYNKLVGALTSKGLKPMEAKGNDFDVELHEAITEIPAPTPELAGKVIDEVEKGYFLNDKIIRFAKVVVGK
jgi:molecular chaperone GrpE